MSDRKITKREQQLIERQERLRKELEQVSAQVQAQEARRRAAAAKKQRADDTRRKILIGACVSAQGVSAEMMRQLDAYLQRDDDRALFNLESLPAPAPEPAPAPAPRPAPITPPAKQPVPAPAPAPVDALDQQREQQAPRGSLSQFERDRGQ